ARDIRVIPIMIDGARMPKASELPESLKPLVRRHAIELRHAQFGRDADALIEKIGEGFSDKSVRIKRWQAAAAAVAALLLLGGIGVFATDIRMPWIMQSRVKFAQLEEELKARRAAEEEARAKAEQAETERIA